MKKIIKLIIVLMFVVIFTDAIFATSFNGIEIPEDLERKFIEYRYRTGRAYAASVDSTYEFSVEEFDRNLKSRVEYDSTSFCPLCKVFFPIRSNYFTQKSSEKTNKLCLDGYPEIIDFHLPPECPYCLCICPEGEFGYRDTVELTYTVYGQRAIYLLPCERYIEFVETLHGKISDYERFQIYFKYAVCGIYKDSDFYLQKAYYALDSFISNHFKEELEKDDYKESLYSWNFKVFFQRVELLRQTGNFDLASKLLAELEKYYDSRYYRGLILEFEKKLILEHNIKRIERPFGNFLHNAIRDNKKINELNISQEELIRLSKQTNVNGNTPFQQAILEQNYEYIEFLLKTVPDILKTEESNDDFKPLHYAAKTGNIRFIELFLKSGCDIEGKSNQMQTPIYLAIRFGHYDAVCYFIQQNANLDVTDQDYNKPLQVAFYSFNKDEIKIMEKLIEKLDKNPPIFKDELQKCLKIAINSGNIEAIEFLKKYLIDIDYSKFSDHTTNPSPKVIFYLSKEKGAEKLLYDSFCSSVNFDWQKHLEAFKNAGLYDKFMKKLGEEKK